MDEDLMAVGIQQIDVSLMVVGAQCTGDNLRTGTAWSRQQNSTKTQCTDVSPRTVGAQWMDVDSRAKTIRPYP